jgi:predicted nucleic acid-binding Zn ribbon protein|tara:strand:+ start:221 stop:625 length:405 start_codon:yes stop_codon:yes gene_type:complete
MKGKHIQPMSAHTPVRAARSILAQWRGVDLTEQERARTNRTRSTAGVMPGLIKKLRLDQRQSEAEIAKVWKSLIDPTVTAHAQPTGIHKGTLFVTVDSNVWLSEIVRYRRHEILQRLQHSFGTKLIARISFRVG